jgi:hypothetical protein
MKVELNAGTDYKMNWRFSQVEKRKGGWNGILKHRGIDLIFGQVKKIFKNIEQMLKNIDKHLNTLVLSLSYCCTLFSVAFSVVVAVFDCFLLFTIALI